MPRRDVKRLAESIIVVATVSLFIGAYWGTVSTQFAATPEARFSMAREYLETISFKSTLEAMFMRRIPDNRSTADVNELALKIMREREPDLEDRVAELYAANFTTQELRAARDFYRTKTGVLYLSFNREMAANPYVTPEMVRNEFANRFTLEQRAEVSAYERAAVGQKMLRKEGVILKALREMVDQWTLETEKIIERSVPGNATPSASLPRLPQQAT